MLSKESIQEALSPLVVLIAFHPMHYLVWWSFTAFCILSVMQISWDVNFWEFAEFVNFAEFCKFIILFYCWYLYQWCSFLKFTKRSCLNKILIKNKYIDFYLWYAPHLYSYKLEMIFSTVSFHLSHGFSWDNCSSYSKLWWRYFNCSLIRKLTNAVFHSEKHTNNTHAQTLRKLDTK